MLLILKGIEFVIPPNVKRVIIGDNWDSVECSPIAQCDDVDDDESEAHTQTLEKMMKEGTFTGEIPATNFVLVGKSVLAFLADGPKRSQDILEFLNAEFPKLRPATIKGYAYTCGGVNKSHGMWYLQQRVPLIVDPTLSAKIVEDA